MDATHATSDDEESVEQYMAKLMERMRGTAGGEPEANEASADAGKSPAPDDAAADAGAEAEVAAPNHEPITDIEELRSKVGVPELAIDMAGDAGAGEPIGATGDRRPHCPLSFAAVHNRA